MLMEGDRMSVSKNRQKKGQRLKDAYVICYTRRLKP